MSDVLLKAEHVTKDFPLKNKKRVHAVTDVSLDIYKGETLALVGESGCGKSTLGRTLIQLIKPTSGDVYFDGDKISGLSEKDFRRYRRRMQLIFQDPYASLNPRMTVRDIVAELLKPGRDVREELPQPILRTDVMEMKDLKPGMVLSGTVRNVIDFGAFVDIGVHQDGLVHISQISNKFIKHPSEVLSVGDVVKVVVLDVDEKKKRIGLSIKQAAGRE